MAAFSVANLFFLCLPFIALNAHINRKMIKAVPPIPTRAAAAPEPAQDKLQDNAATRRNSPAAANTERIMSVIFAPFERSLSFFIALTCSFNNFFLSFHFSWLPFPSFNDE